LTAPPLIVEALARLRSKSCILDGEAVACDGNGMPTFDRIRYRGHDGRVFLYAFEPIELNGDDLRTDPLENPQGHANQRLGPGRRRTA
jgi:ATP-dependent DNA ligase